MKDLVPIVFASELPSCPDCGEPWCPVHKLHYYECACLGPANAEDEGYDIVEKKGRLFGVKKIDKNAKVQVR